MAAEQPQEYQTEDETKTTHDTGSGGTSTGGGRGTTIHIFSVASGLQYERLLRIMFASARHATDPVYKLKFYLLRDFLSPSFLKSLREDNLIQRRLPNTEVELLSMPPWPLFLKSEEGEPLGIRNDKQRLIWAYKILFLDTLFYGKTDRVIFVDADQIVKSDLAELWKTNMRGKPWGFTPFCKNDTLNEKTLGHRFWENKDGYWYKSFLSRRGNYHISALFVVDLDAYVEFADHIRKYYGMLAGDPGSLSNLDQDLPNSLQFEVPIFSLDKSWLWCESWCALSVKEKAKTIDLCQNPLTKEHKLDMAVGENPLTKEHPRIPAPVDSNTRG